MTSNSPTAGEAIARELTAIATAFRAANAEIDDTLDEEAVHQARVALRRLRSLLRTFSALFQRGFASDVRTDLQWFGNQLGSLRDADVTVALVEAYLSEHSLVDGLSLLAYLRAEQHDAQQSLRDARANPRYALVVSHIDKLAANPPFSKRAEHAARNEFAAQLSRPWRDVREAARVAARTSAPLDIHQLRIRCKELRYAAETTAAVLGEDATKLASAARRVQDRLGAHQDARRLLSVLEEFGRYIGSQDSDLEELRATQRRIAKRALDTYEQDLKKLRRRWRKLRNSMRSPAKVTTKSKREQETEAANSGVLVSLEQRLNAERAVSP